MQSVIELTEETTALASELRELAQKLNRAVSIIQETSTHPPTDIRLPERLKSIVDDIRLCRDHLTNFSEMLTAL